MVRKKNRAQAVMYAKKHFGAFLQTDQEELCQCLSMLVAVRPIYWPSPYQRMLGGASEKEATDGWADLIEFFSSAFFSLYGLPRESMMPALIQCGCAAFKTPACRCDGSGNLNCPSCNPVLEPLTRNLPFAHFEYSRLICRISNTVMSDDNPPMALPNGQIYSLKVTPDS